MPMLLATRRWAGGTESKRTASGFHFAIEGEGAWGSHKATGGSEDDGEVALQRWLEAGRSYMWSSKERRELNGDTVWWGHHYVGYNHSFYWGAGTNYDITSTTTTSSSKLVLIFVR
jgi:hypothetical protein